MSPAVSIIYTVSFEKWPVSGSHLDPNLPEGVKLELENKHF